MTIIVVRTSIHFEGCCCPLRNKTLVVGIGLDINWKWQFYLSERSSKFIMITPTIDSTPNNDIKKFICEHYRIRNRMVALCWAQCPILSSHTSFWWPYLTTNLGVQLRQVTTYVIALESLTKGIQINNFIINQISSSRWLRTNSIITSVSHIMCTWLVRC